MKQISKKEVVQTIINEALVIKRKRELFEEAKKINTELKQLNEYGHPAVGLGFGFKNSTSPSPIIGDGPVITGPTMSEPEKCGCKLDQFQGLEKDIEDFGTKNHEENEEGAENVVDAVQKLKDENEQLKMQLAQIKDSVNALNEGLIAKPEQPKIENSPEIATK